MKSIQNLKNNWTTFLSVTLLFLALIIFNGNRFSVKNTQENSKAEIYLSPKNMKVIYKGIENPIDLYVSGISKNELNIKATNAKVIFKNKTCYLIPKRYGNCIIQIFHNDKEIGERVLWVLRIPDPSILLQNKYFRISKSQLVDNSKLFARANIYPSKVDFEILEFTLNTKTEILTQNIKTKGDQLSKKQLNLLRELPIGSEFSFSNISVIGPDSIKRNIQKVTYTLE